MGFQPSCSVGLKSGAARTMLRNLTGLLMFGFARAGLVSASKVFYYLAGPWTLRHHVRIA